ncbi:porin [Roseovarius dicentrarchi]|uniref:porin n=1 Tax=Roseovarius dicentrarchi TaxID=2250573 RepID=UPI000DEBA1FD|nr:porin [Roseovarius dicentrarchi]
MTHIHTCYSEEGHTLKKHLLSTSAIALGVAMAAPAAAQEWDVSFGGFMSQHVGYADVGGSMFRNTPAGIANNQDRDGVFMHSSTEIIFTPSVTLDNGLTFGVNVQLEGENQGGQTYIDETYMTISSDTLGRIVVGSENSAGYTLMTSAPVVTSMAINSPSISSFIPFSGTGVGAVNNGYPGGFRQAGLSSFTEVAGNNDVQRLSYYTPSFNGLTVGISYAPNATINAVNGGNFNRNSTLSDVFDIGVNYSQTFGTTSVTLAARYGTANASALAAGVSDPETWGIGAQIGFGAFTIGGSYSENDNGSVGGRGAVGGIAAGTDYGNDSTGWNLGMTYDIAGPWAVEFVTYQGETKATGGGTADYEAYRIGASRDLGPGVDWDIYVAQVDADNGQVGAARRTIDGTVIGTGINLSF